MKKYLLVVLVLMTMILSSQDRDAKKGQELFKVNCRVCHDLDSKVLGPPLRDIEKKRDSKWLFAWIKDNQKLRESGDKDAIEIYEEYGGALMQSFPGLSDEDISNILEYTSNPPVVETEKPEIALLEEEQQEKSAWENQENLNIVFFAATVIIIFLIILLVRLKRLLYVVVGKEEGTLKSDILVLFDSLLIILKNKFVLPTILFLVMSGGLYYSWEFLINIGVDKGYQPIQPIKFSHKIHAGDNGIDCKYCHSSAGHSKTAGVPSANVCMNCHRFIQEGATTGKGEIAKIYEAIGFDPDKGGYIENYEQKPIEWIKVHNLQDFVFFSHKQHVEVGALECQECHGPVEEMDEVYQYSDLTMGWCVDCHRNKEVKMEGSEYYEKIHEQLKNKYKTEKITVSMIGGLECGKCHY